MGPSIGYSAQKDIMKHTAIGLENSETGSIVADLYSS